MHYSDKYAATGTAAPKTGMDHQTFSKPDHPTAPGGSPADSTCHGTDTSSASSHTSGGSGGGNGGGGSGGGGGLVPGRQAPNFAGFQASSWYGGYARPDSVPDCMKLHASMPDTEFRVGGPWRPPVACGQVSGQHGPLRCRQTVTCVDINYHDTCMNIRLLVQAEFGALVLCDPLASLALHNLAVGQAVPQGSFGENPLFMTFMGVEELQGCADSFCRRVCMRWLFDPVTHRWTFTDNRTNNDSFTIVCLTSLVAPPEHEGVLVGMPPPHLPCQQNMLTRLAALATLRSPYYQLAPEQMEAARWFLEEAGHVHRLAAMAPATHLGPTEFVGCEESGPREAAHAVRAIPGATSPVPGTPDTEMAGLKASAQMVAERAMESVPRGDVESPLTDPLGEGSCPAALDAPGAAASGVVNGPDDKTVYQRPGPACSANPAVNAARLTTAWGHANRFRGAMSVADKAMAEHPAWPAIGVMIDALMTGLAQAPASGPLDGVALQVAVEHGLDTAKQGIAFIEEQAKTSTQVQAAILRDVCRMLTRVGASLSK